MCMEIPIRKTNQWWDCLIFIVGKLILVHEGIFTLILTLGLNFKHYIHVKLWVLRTWKGIHTQVTCSWLKSLFSLTHGWMILFCSKLYIKYYEWCDMTLWIIFNIGLVQYLNKNCTWKCTSQCCLSVKRQPFYLGFNISTFMVRIFCGRKVNIMLHLFLGFRSAII